MELVLVTGASGYLAGHIIHELLDHGYQVRGTVRNPAKAAHLPDAVELVTADLERDDGWAAAVAGCRYVLYTASPFPATQPTDPDALVGPAVDGTLRVLHAVAIDGGVSRVVLTSSIAAIRWGTDEDRERTEEDWSDPDRCNPYARSKTLAERAAWDFVASLDGFELAVVNPGLLLGPLHTTSVPTSLEVVAKLLNRKGPGSPEGISFAVTDVRDVAAGHRFAMTTPAAAGQRYILAGPPYPLLDVARTLHGLGYQVPTRRIPLWVLARFDPTVRQALGYVNRPDRLRSAKAARDLGWTLWPVERTIADTAASLVAHGLAKR